MHGVWGERRKVNDAWRREIIAEKAIKALENSNSGNDHSKLMAAPVMLEGGIIKKSAILSKQKEPFQMKPHSLAQMQLEDETLNICRERMNLKRNEGSWMIYKECLHKVRKHHKKDTKTIQLVLPKPLREGIMIAYHDELMAGHCGYFKTAQKIAQWYWWPEMYKDIKEWVVRFYILPYICPNSWY